MITNILYPNYKELLQLNAERDSCLEELKEHANKRLRNKKDIENDGQKDTNRGGKEI